MEIIYFLSLFLISAIPSLAHPDSSVDLERQVRHLIFDSLDALEDSQHCEEWESFLHHELKPQIRDWSHSPQGALFICRHLSILPLEDLATFQEILEDEVILHSLYCGKQLSHRLSEYYQNQAQNLNHYILQTEPRTGLQGLELQDLEGPTLRPSTSKSIPRQGGPVLFNAGLDPGQVNLTFDDGPHPTRTQQVLKVLAQENIQANFFVLGQNAERHPEITRQIREQGHEVGGHSYSHPDLRRLSFEKAQWEIFEGLNVVSRILGTVTDFFRFPYGARTTALQQTLRQRDIVTVFWNIDTLDWKIRDPLELYQYALQQTEREGRGIILFHDIHPQTVAMLPQFIRSLKARNYEAFVLR